MRFQDLIGQEEAVARVQDAVANNRLAHALMITGPSGVGKLAFAQSIAQYVNCLNPKDGDSCGRCASCIKISKLIHPDMRYVLPIISKTEGGKRYLTGDYFDRYREAYEEDPYVSFSQWQRALGGESKQLFISVHEIRDLKRNIYLKAFEAKYKVILVWQAELINTEGANAFLKLLEEPPDRTMIIMTCSDPSRLLTTINSRCQRIAVGRIPTEKVQHYLVDRLDVASEQAEEAAAISEGSIGNAKESLTDSAAAISETYAEWLRAAYLGDYSKIQAQVEKVYKENKEFQKLFLQISIKKMRDSMLYHLQLPQLALATQKEKAFQEKFSKIITADKVDRITREMDQCRRQIAGNANSQMVFTALSLRMHSILRG
ncbi:MAG: hypothetical protein AAF206_21610 [Bacteroidota bacterium]